MSDEFKLPKKKAVIYWPVATGDSTTLVLKPDEVVMQIDLHHLEKAADEDSTEWSIPTSEDRRAGTESSRRLGQKAP